MKLRVAGVYPASNKEWDDVWNHCSYATYFHGRHWAEIWAEYTNGRIRPAPLLIDFSDGEWALFPLSQELRLGGLLHRAISSPAGTYGGWISKRRLTDEHARLLINWIGQYHRNITWRQNPYVPTRVSIPADSMPDHTRTICLDVGFESVFRYWTKGHRSAVSKALRNGVSIHLARTESEWLDYFVTYEDSLRRWGHRASSRYGPRLFQILCRQASLDDNLKLWLACHEGLVIAGAVCVYSPHVAVYWHGAALERTIELRPVNLLMYEAIRDAVGRGLGWFDFNPSGGHLGVEAFKKSFGAQQKPANVAQISSIEVRALNAMSCALKSLRK